MLKLENITVRYGDNTVIDNFSIDLSNSNITAIVGESGSGKTTLLNAIAGNVKLNSGKVVCDKKISFMFQEPRLFPWLTALQNVNVVLNDDITTVDTAKTMLDYVGINDYDKYPDELSGGMKQRVALARALVYDADLLVLDEPFSSVDAQNRRALLQLLKSDGRQIVFVTHNSEDTIIADTVITLD